MKVIGIGLVAATLIWVGVAHAIPVRTYALELDFQTCVRGDATTCLPSDAVHAGSQHTGYFAIAEQVFATDGYKDGVGFESFNLQLGETIWNSLDPDSDLVGTRGYNPMTGVGGFVPWTLLVENGELAGLCCGIFGPGDSVFVDFFSWNPPGASFGPNHVNALGYLSRDFPQPQIFFAQGTFAIHRVPEPSTVALLLMGIAILIRIRPPWGPGAFAR